MKNFRKLTACLLAVLMIVSVFPVSVFAQTVTPKDVLRDASDEDLAIIVTFDPNGGSCDVETAEVNAEGCLDELPQPVWLGHDFLGWFTEAEGGEEVTLETVFNESATVYAQWTGDEGSDDSDENLPIIITFDANGGECDVASAETNAEGKLTELPEPTWEGYTFYGWFTEMDGGEKITLDTVFAESVTVYAHWQDNEASAEDLPIFVTFDANGGVCEIESAETAMGRLTVLPEAEREGFSFLGWFTEPEGGEEITTDTVFTANTTVYAHWKEVEEDSAEDLADVTWMNEDEVLKTETVRKGEIPVYDGETPVKAADAGSHYVFAGWTSGSSVFGPDDELPPVEENVVYTAVFAAEPHTFTDEVTTEPTCTEEGLRTYTCVCGWTYTETIEALGHAWSEPTFTFSEDGTAATATRVCGNDPTHTETKDCTVTAEISLVSTCTEPGETTYTATVEFDGVTYTAETTRTNVEPLGHDWSEPMITFAEDGTTAVACRVCSRNAAHVEFKTCTVTAVTTEPTCEEPGIVTYTAAVEFDGVTYTDTTTREYAPALGHAWGEPVIAFSEDGTAATATRVCANDPAHVETRDCTVTAEITTAPTCTEDGVTTYTAVVEFDGVTYTETTTRADVPATGHDWDYPTFAFSEDYTSATALCVCLNDETHTMTLDCTVQVESEEAPTCTEPGLTVYVATVEFEGEIYVSEAYVDGAPALGHDWAEPVFTFSEDGTVAVACRVCARDASHVEFRLCTVTAAVTTPATCTEPGVTTYTATAEFDGKTYTASTTRVDVPALGHTAGPVVVENEVAPTCTEDGSYDEVVYCSVCGAELERKTVTTPATGHSYGEPVWTWNEELTEATAVFTCTACGDEQTLTAEITEEITTEAAPHVEGEKKLTAKVTFEGVEYTDEKTAVIEALPCPCAMFKDMPEYGTDEHAAIDWAYTHDPQITKGTSKTKFSPDKTVTRAQAATFLWRAAGCPTPKTTENPFTDVVEGEYYYEAVLWAVEEGITTGTSKTKFSPAKTCSIEQIITFLYRFEHEPDVTGLENPYTDAADGFYSTNPLIWAYHNGIYTGKTETESGRTDGCTRAQIVTFLWRDIAPKEAGE